jgi:hypothetical protein
MNFYTQNEETNSNIEFLQTYPIAAADALLEMGTAVMFCRSMNSCHRQFLLPEVLLPVSVLLSYSVLICRIRVAK